MCNTALQTPQRPWAHSSPQLRMPTRTEHSRWSHQSTPCVHMGAQAPCTHSHMCTRSPAELQARSPQKESVLAPSPADTGSTSIGSLPSLPVFWPQQVPSSAGNLRELAHSESCRLQTLGVQSSLVQRQKAGGGECGAEGGKEGTLHPKGLVGVE